MSTPTKFTAERRGLFLEAVGTGASRQTACAYAGFSDESFRRWFNRGKEAKAGSLYRKFHDDVLKAEAEPRLGALRILRDAWIDRPELAWKFVERREPGYAPPMPDKAPAVQQQVIVLTLDDGRPVTPALRAVANEAEDQAS